MIMQYQLIIWDVHSQSFLAWLWDIQCTKNEENVMKLTHIKIIHGTNKSHPEANYLHLERLLSRISIILKSSSKFRTKLKMLPKGSSWEGFDWRLMITQQQSICKSDSQWISSKLAASGYESKLTFHLIFNHFE